MSGPDVQIGVCRFCGCSDAQACDGGCSWSGDDQTCCSQCAGAVEIASDLVKILGVVAATPKAGLRLSTARWEALPLEQQCVLVMTCRATVDGIREALVEALDEDALDASLELSVITRFLLERCPEAIEEDESVSQVIIRLLEPHIGSRIVLAEGVDR